MLQHLNGLLCLQFKRCKWTLDYKEIEGIAVLKVFDHCQKLTFSSLRCASTILNFLQDVALFYKRGFAWPKTFELLLQKHSIFFSDF